MTYLTRIFMVITCCTVMFAQKFLPIQKQYEKPLRGDEIILHGRHIPYCGGRQSPGDSIGMTWYEHQSNGQWGQRLMVDDYGQAHVNWMWMDSAMTLRYCAWNARFADGSYFGETQASPSWSGFVQLDITRDENPDSQRTVICYHYDNGSGYFSWIDIDTGNVQGSWPNDPKHIDDVEHIWPKITVASNNNILLAAGDQNADQLHLYLTTDLGNTWNTIADFDSCWRLTHFIRASRNYGSAKVVFTWTKFISDSFAPDYDQNVCYVMSTDNGVTWGNRVNITNYQPYPQDSVRAYLDVNAVFDNNDVLHITWGGRKIDSTQFWEKSKIFHWDEINDTITIVSSPSIYYYDPGGWWITTTENSGYPGCHHMPACESQLIVDASTNYLYCLWNGNDDTSDVSLGGLPGGFLNGELYGSYSTDNGLTWADYVNLTNTRSPGAPAGACMDEDYMTACPYTVNDSIYITFIEDKDAGGAVQGEGEWTENPVRLWVFHKNLITGIQEHDQKSPAPKMPGSTILAGPLVLPEDKNYKILDIIGRQVHTLDPAPGIYFIEVDEEIQQKVIKIR